MTRALQPWPSPAGAANDGTTPVPFRGGSAVRWHVDLGQRLARYIVADVEGRWFAQGGGFVMAGDRAMRWRNEASVFMPCLLHDGLLVLPRPEPTLSALRPESGREAWTATGSHFYAAPSGGGLVTCEYRRPDWFLVSLDAQGAMRWSRPAREPVDAPLVLPGETIVAVGRRMIEGLAGDGNLLWTATPDGFDAAEPKEKEFTTAAVGLERGRIAVGTAAYEWRGYSIVDPAHRSVMRWPPPGWIAPDATPIAVRRSPAPEALITRLQATMLVSSVDGPERWSAALPTVPYAYAVDPQGRIAVAYSHSAEYHDRYNWGDVDGDLRGRCGVALFAPAGEELWRWDAPGPLGGFAVNAAGEVLVTSEGRLWALG